MPFLSADGVVGGMHAHHAVSDIGHRADIAGLQAVRRQRLLGGLAEVVDRIRALHHADVARVQQAPHVILEAEHRRATVRKLVGPDPLERAEAVVEGMGEDVNLGVVPVHELPIHPDRLQLVHPGAISR
jgi:hypothetical protein